MHKGEQGLEYNLLKQALDVSALKQETISNNIANVNTPDFKSDKVLFEDYFKNSISKNTLSNTHERHFAVGNTLPRVEKNEDTFIQDNGNNVDIDYEMAELSANNLYYDAVVSQLNAQYAMIRSVIR